MNFNIIKVTSKAKGWQFPEIKDWLKDRKDDIRLVMSVDGTEAMQQKNRGSDFPVMVINQV